MGVRSRVLVAPEGAAEVQRAGGGQQVAAAPVVSMRAVAGLLSGGAPAGVASAMLPSAGGNTMVARLLDSGTASAPAPGADVAARISALSGGGKPLPAEVRAEAEAGLGQPLGDVRLHDDAEAAVLATRLGARAFTSGSDIFFNTGEYRPSTPDGYELLAHELTHTLQQSSGSVQGRAAAPGLRVSEPHDPDEQVAYATAQRLRAAREAADASAPPRPAVEPSPAPAVGRAVRPGAAEGVVQRAAEGLLEVAREGTGESSLLDDLIPDFILDGVKSAVSAIPGYTMLTQVIGTDPITDRPVHAGPEQLVESVLTYGPFGEATGRLLRTIDIIDDVLDAVHSRLAAHNLTLARIVDEIAKAWDELSITAGIDGNIAVVERHVDAVLIDARAAISELIDQVIELVRSVIAEVAEPFLNKPEIKPVWDLAKKVLHHDPLRGTEVNAPTVEILADFLKLIGREQTLQQLRERGTLQQAADWLDTQFATFVGIKNDLVQLFADAWNAIQPQNLPRLLDTLPYLADRAFALVRRIAGFAATIMGKALELVKQSLLGPLSERARRIPGFPLLTVIIGQDPFTGEAVPRNAENLIRGFITLLPDGEATYSRLAESGVIAEAAARIEGEIARLGISADLIVGTFRNIWDGLSLDDLLDPIGAFQRILREFGEPVSRIVEFVGVVLEVVVTLIIELMNFPTELVGSIISNAVAAIEDIKRDPVQFLLNMLQALKTGFLGFLDGIGTYLLEGLSNWLLRGLGQLGITVPTDLSAGAVLDLTMQVLGISTETLWEKLGQRIGPERVAQLRAGIDHLSGAWAFIKDVQEHGVSAVYDYVADRLSDLWDTVLQMATDWIMTQVIQRATAKLISMLDPTGVMAVINSCIAFFNAVQSAIEYIRDILQIVEQYTQTIAQVARGDIQPGAEKVTRGLADAVPVAIGFLANQVGIGNVPEQIVEIIKGLRELVDRALDWLFDQAMRLGAAALNALTGGATPGAAQDNLRLEDLIHQEPFDLGAEHHRIEAGIDPAQLTVHSDPVLITVLITQYNSPDLQAKYTAYCTAVAEFKTAIQARDAAPGAQQQLASGTPKAKKDAVDETLKELIRTIRTLKGFDPNHPGASAPGIGTVSRHGDQQRKLRQGVDSTNTTRLPADVPLWAMESEHVLPFMSIFKLFDVGGFQVGSRPAHKREDDYMHTILLYSGASYEKTHGNDVDSGDLRKIEAFKEELDADAAERRHEANAADLRETGPGGWNDAETIRNETLEKVQEKLNELARDAMDRLIPAIAAEIGRNGPARGNEPVVPSEQAVAEALVRQMADVHAIAARLPRKPATH